GQQGWLRRREKSCAPPERRRRGGGPCSILEPPPRPDQEGRFALPSFNSRTHRPTCALPFATPHPAVAGPAAPCERPVPMHACATSGVRVPFRSRGAFPDTAISQ